MVDPTHHRQRKKHRREDQRKNRDRLHRAGRRQREPQNFPREYGLAGTRSQKRGVLSQPENQTACGLTRLQIEFSPQKPGFPPKAGFLHCNVHQCDMMKLGYKEKEVGKILNEMLDKVDGDEIENNHDSLLNYAIIQYESKCEIEYGLKL